MTLELVGEVAVQHRTVFGSPDGLSSLVGRIDGAIVFRCRQECEEGGDGQYFHHDVTDDRGATLPPRPSCPFSFLSHFIPFKLVHWLGREKETFPMQTDFLQTGCH